MNAIAHAVEGLYAEDCNPIVTLMALEAIRAMAEGLPAILDRPRDPASRAKALYGAWLCGAVLGSVGMALHHKLCHTLGGSFNLPHAETHTVVLPHALAYNRDAAPQAMARIAAALCAQNAAQGVYDLARSLGAPTSLAAIGMPEAGLERAVELACTHTYFNPRPVERGAIRRLLQDAWEGRRPA